MNATSWNPEEVQLGHHWFAARRGGERTFEQMAALFPGAPVATLICRREALGGDLPARTFQLSRLARVSPRWIDHRQLLLLYPGAVRGLRVPSTKRLLLTSDAALLKGMRKPPGCVHVCYCHSPPRYLWELTDEYLARTASMGPLKRWIFRRSLPRLRRFDRNSADAVDHFIANSRFVAERIRRTYGRDATVIHPPVEIARFASPAAAGDVAAAGYYLTVSELVAYKRIDLAVGACSQSGRRLVVIGDGPEFEALRRNAGPTVEFVGRVPDAEVARRLAGCRALLHPQIEDFGIAPVEAQAAGRPVIAFRGGGALETVTDGVGGLFFDAQTPEALLEALDRFEQAPAQWSAENCRREAARFAPDRFQRELAAFLNEVHARRAERLPA